MATSSEPSARRGARPLGRRVDRVPRAAPRRARRAGIHGAGALGCLCFRHGGRTRSPIVPAWFYGPSRKQFTAFGWAGRSGWNGRKAMPFCKGWAPPALELRAGAPATTRSRVASGTRRRPGGPLFRRGLENPNSCTSSALCWRPSCAGDGVPEPIRCLNIADFDGTSRRQRNRGDFRRLGAAPQESSADKIFGPTLPSEASKTD